MVRSPKAFTKPSLTMDKNNIAPPLKFEKQKDLHERTDEFDENENIFVELLIGANCINGLKPTDISQNREGVPYTFQTKLGSCIVGSVNEVSTRKISCNRIAIKQTDINAIGEHYFQTKSNMDKTDVTEMVNKIYNQ